MTILLHGATRGTTRWARLSDIDASYHAQSGVKMLSMAFVCMSVCLYVCKAYVIW